MTVKRHMAAFLSMSLGSALVFGALYLMNEAGAGGPPAELKEPVAFQVAEAPKKKPPQRPKPQPRKVERRSVTPKLAPTPSLASAIGGISFDLAGFEAADLGGVGDDMLGASAAKNMVMTEDAVDKKPVPRRQEPPAFPEKARQRGIQGYVKLNLYIDTTGVVQKIKVLEAEPRGVFEESAVAAAQHWEFDPAEYNGAPVTGWFKRTVSFRLN